MSAADKFAEADKLEKQAQSIRQEGHAEWLKEQRARVLQERLVYAAFSRCPCGAGLAYDPAGASGGYQEHGENDGPFKGSLGGYWDCSAIILGTAIPKGQPGSVQHTDRLPFAFYEVKSERQPSAGGATTRPVASTDGDKQR